MENLQKIRSEIQRLHSVPFFHSWSSSLFVPIERSRILVGPKQSSNELILISNFKIRSHSRRKGHNNHFA